DSAGDDCTDTDKREGALDGEAKAPFRSAAVDSSSWGEHPSAERFTAFPGDDRNGYDIAAGEAGSFERPRDFCRDFCAPLAGDEIDFRHRDKPAIDAEQIDNSEMLARLRHNAVVGRNYQQHEIDAAGARQHVV